MSAAMARLLTARGLPQAVNNIATQALVAAMADRKNIVDEQSARTVVSEITSD
jgi:type II secretory pathway predicted ATPase ExeA